MIIFISALAANFDSPMSARFGRTPWFIRYNTETATWEAVENIGPDQPGGAGVATTQLSDRPGRRSCHQRPVWSQRQTSPSSCGN